MGVTTGAVARSADQQFITNFEDHINQCYVNQLMFFLSENTIRDALAPPYNCKCAVSTIAVLY